MSTQTEQQKQISNALQPGTSAPNFTLRTTPDQSVSLDQFRGNPVIILFYPADFSPVCGDEVSLYNEILPEFQRFNAEVIGISVDGVWCHLAFSKHKKLRFPLLSDFEPKGDVAQKYGVYRKNDGVTERARPPRIRCLDAACSRRPSGARNPAALAEPSHSCAQSSVIAPTFRPPSSFKLTSILSGGR